MKMDNPNHLDEKLAKEKILQDRIENVAWTHEEKLFKNRLKLVRPKLRTAKVPLSLALKISYRRSIFGQYLDEFNHREYQNQYLNKNKLAMTLYDQAVFSEVDWTHFRERNDDFLMKNTMCSLKEAVAKLDMVDVTYLRDRFTCIRLNNLFINDLDDGLYDYKKLKIIHLNGNWIKRIPGEVFPKALQCLNLYVNSIDSFDDAIKELPNIFVLGLGRNLLHDHSRLHLLSESQNLHCLRSLDLSNNEICDLHYLLTCLKTLKHLRCLELEGNPCYVKPFYKDVILKNIPQLLYLDNVQILDKDRVFSEENDTLEDDAAIIFSCHRIIGLPPPPKQKGVIQTIHLEVFLPLLEEVVIPVEKLENAIENALPVVSNTVVKKGKKSNDRLKKDKKNKEKSNKIKTDGKSKPRKGKGSKSKINKEKGNLFYNAEDEYENEVTTGVINAAFCTEHVPWSKIIQFPEETIIIKSPVFSQLKNVIAIRDTFRSRVNIKVVYLKIQIPQKTKVQKGKPKSSSATKSKQTKNKSGKSSKTNKDKSVDKKEKNPVEEIRLEEKPREVILKKVTLASFNCNLHPVSWSDKTIDFYWADHEDCKTNAIAVDGSLRAINYVDSNKKGKTKPNKTQSKSSVRTAGRKPQEIDIELPREENEEQICPKIFTVQVGFGLKRCYEV